MSRPRRCKLQAWRSRVATLQHAVEPRALADEIINHATTDVAAYSRERRGRRVDVVVYDVGAQPEAVAPRAGLRGRPSVQATSGPMVETDAAAPESPVDSVHDGQRPESRAITQQFRGGSSILRRPRLSSEGGNGGVRTAREREQFGKVCEIGARFRQGNSGMERAVLAEEESAICQAAGAGRNAPPSTGWGQQMTTRSIGGGRSASACSALNG